MNEMPTIVGSSYAAQSYGGIPGEMVATGIAQEPDEFAKLMRAQLLPEDSLSARVGTMKRRVQQHILHANPSVIDFVTGVESETKTSTTQQNPNMSQKRIVQIFVADPDTRVPVEKSILINEPQKATDLTDQELFYELDIKTALEKHNAERVKMLDKAATAKAGRDVFLDPVKIRDLKMTVVNVATF